MKASGSKIVPKWLIKLLFWLNAVIGLLMIGAYLGTHFSPNTIPYLSFLGLAYPIILVANLVFIGVWLLLKRRNALMSFIIIVLGWNHLGNFYAFNFSEDELENPLKIISYNVRIFDFYNLNGREQNRNSIFKFLNDENADVLCFQEFYHQDNSNTFVTKDSMISLLNTPYYHERYTHEMTGKRYFGVATFSKYPIINKGEIKFKNDDNNFCIYSDILKETDTVRVFNAHLGSIRFQSDDYKFFGDDKTPNYPKDKKAGQRIFRRLKLAFEKRAIQAEQVAEEVSKSPYPVIFCADMNDTPVSYCYRQFSDLMIDAFVNAGSGIGETYIGKIPSNRIDYIFHDNSFGSSDFVTHQVNYSDHKPVSCLVGKVR